MRTFFLTCSLLACAPDPAPGGGGPDAVDGTGGGTGAPSGDEGGGDDGGGEDDGGGDEGTGGDEGGGDDGGGDDGSTGGEDPPWDVDAIVIAGDSWSTGSVNPTRALLDAEGYSGVALTWEDTAVAGSQASEWAANQDGKRDKLDAALAGTAWGRPEADLLLLYLGGNDLNFALHEGLPGWVDRDTAVSAVLDDIEDDLQTLVDHALSQNPDLHVVIVGYDYFHIEWMTALFGFSLDADGFLEYNQDLAALEARKLGIARRTDRVHYAHNLGTWTHHLGNPITVPFSLPLADYPAGFFDAPSTAPDYDPFPGGARRSDIDPNVIPPETLPGPTTALLDGIHPNDTGWTTLLGWTWDQGLERLVAEGTWAP